MVEESDEEMEKEESQGEPEVEEEEEEEEEEIIESDVELEGETVEPDNDPPQKVFFFLRIIIRRGVFWLHFSFSYFYLLWLFCLIMNLTICRWGTHL